MKNAEDGMGGCHRLFGLFWTLDTTIIFFSSVSCNLLYQAREAVAEVIPAGSRACGSGASSSGLAPAGEVRNTDKQCQQFQERGGDMIFCTI